MSILLDWCQQLQNTWVGTSIRESTLVFPVLEGSHLLGLALMMAPVVMYDLRLVGLLRRNAQSVIDNRDASDAVARRRVATDLAAVRRELDCVVKKIPHDRLDPPGVDVDEHRRPRQANVEIARFVCCPMLRRSLPNASLRTRGVCFIKRRHLVKRP